MGRSSSIAKWLFGLFIVAMAGAASAQPLRDVTVGLSSGSLGTAAPRLAKELGFFEKRGINPKFVVMESGNAAVSALVSRSIDFSVAGPGDLILAQAHGQKMVVLANAYNGLVTSLVISKSTAEKLGISPSAPLETRLKALDGMVIGSPSATSVVTTAYGGGAKALGANIRFTYMSQQAMPAALESGAILGYAASAPFWAVPVVKGEAVLWINGPKGEVPYDYSPTMSAQLQATRSFAEANPELCRSMKDALADLAKAVDDRPADVKAALAKLYPELDGPTLDLLFVNESPAWKGKPVTAQQLAHEVAIVKSTGIKLPELDSIDAAAMLVQ